MTMKFIIIAWIQIFSAQHNVDPILVEAIVKTESSYNYLATGSIGEIGLMQMRHEYLNSPDRYYDPYLNLQEGISRLAKYKRLEPELGKYWFVAWNLGPRGALNKKHTIKEFAYSRKVMKNYAILKKEHDSGRSTNFNIFNIRTAAVSSFSY